MSGENKKKCYLCGQEYEPGYPYVGNSAICPTCWAKVNAGTKVEKINIAEGVELTRYIPAALLKTARQRFEIKKDGLSTELTKWATDHEERVNKEIKALGIDKEGALPTEEQLAKLTSILLRAMYDYTAELRAENERLQAKTALVKVSDTYLKTYFVNEETLKRWQGQLALNFDSDVATVKKALSIAINRGYEPLSFTYWQNRVIRGIFALCEKQQANYTRPFIVLDSRAQLYAEILEKRRTRRTKEGYIFHDYGGKDMESVDEALDQLNKAEQDIFVKGRDENGKEFFYMKEDAKILEVEYFKGELSAEEGEALTKDLLKKTGTIKISITPAFLRGYNKYFKLLPKDISQEIRKACPEVRKVSEPMVNFFDYLHRQEEAEIHRTRDEIYRAMKIPEEQIKKQGRDYFDRMVRKIYDIAKRAGYLTGYKLDQTGKLELVDVLYLNEGKYYCLAMLKRSREEKKALEEQKRREAGGNQAGG